MAQQTSLPQLSIDTHLRTDQETSSLSSQPSVEFGKSSSHGSVPRSSPRILDSASHISPTINQQGRRRARPKSVPFGPQNNSSRGSPARILGTTRAGSHMPKMKRVSKAKKGQKVHVCDFGCGKVFTRKEHQKRHEANHRPDFEFPCLVKGCPKAFQRKDLLIRHMDKQHDMPIKTSDIKTPPARPSASDSFGSVSETSVSTTASVTREDHLTVASATNVCSSTGLLLGSPEIQDGFSPIHPLQLSYEVSQLSLAPAALAADLRDSVQTMPDLDYEPFASCGMYSSTCSSPMSDLPYPQNITPQIFPYGAKSQSISSSSSTEHTWGDFNITSSANGHFGGAFDDEGSFLQPVEPSLPISVSCIDGDEYLAPWRSLVGKEDVLFRINKEQTQHYLDCYRQCFDPLFPIVHFPTAKAGLSQRRLLAAAMIVIGAQFSPRENAKTFSASLHQKCLEVLAKRRDPITSRSRISDQQSVILLEAFSRYRGRSCTVHMSSDFKALYTSLLDERESLRAYPPIYAGSGYLHDSGPKFEKSRKDWIDHETKRRMLLTAFVLDTHQYVLYQEPSCYTPGVSKSLDLPSLCSSQLWECNDAKDWRRLVRHHTAVDLTRLQNGRLAVPPASINAFESSIIQCCQIQIQTRLLTSPSSPFTAAPFPALHTSRETLFTHHALHLAALTPIRHLLLVSGESWLFGTKVPHHHLWHDAKLQLRAWTSTPRAPQAVWHATHALRLSLPPDSADASHPPLRLLHEQWSIYLAALVCWAFGYSPPASQRHDPPLWTWPTAPAYLAAMDVASWRDVAAVPERAYTNGLLEGVAAKLLGRRSGADGKVGTTTKMRGLGRLLSEAVEVLGALGEGRPLVDF